MWISEGGLVFYCYVTNYHKFSSLKQHPLITPQFLWVWARLSWVLCSVSHRAAVKISARQHSFLEPGILLAEWIALQL